MDYDESIDPDLFRRAKANSARMDREFIAKVRARGWLTTSPQWADSTVERYVGAGMCTRDELARIELWPDGKPSAIFYANV